MKIIFLELNEFNAELLQTASQIFGLKNIEKMLSFHHTHTITEDTYESDFLEPWVQWVSVHTGHPSSIHGIKHLGDIPHLGMDQIWGKLSKMGVSSGIWGAMNASLAGAEHCHFFLPDPWTFSEEAHPTSLNQLLDPLRYTSKNYLNRSYSKILQKLKGLIHLFVSYRLGWQVLRKIPSLIRHLVKFKGAHFVFISFAEKISTLLFLKYREKFNPDFSLIFINSLAHLQHHYWTDSNYKENKRLKHGLKNLDQMLELLFSSLNTEDLFIVANALSQKNTNEETPWILYRQIDQNLFLTSIGIQDFRVEPHMTHDAHLFFESEEACNEAKERLTETFILGKPLFLVETYPPEDKKLFYRLCFTDEIPPETQFTVRDKTFRFFDLFKQVVQRTGKHIPNGTLYSSKDCFPKTIQNHEIFNGIMKIFEKSQIPNE